jgi:hypothetical protein
MVKGGLNSVSDSLEPVSDLVFQTSEASVE